MRRLCAILLALALAPGLWWRSPEPAFNYWAPVTISRLPPLPLPARRAGDLALEGAWLLDSARPRFGGYSGLVAVGAGGLLAVSDGGQALEIALAAGRPAAARQRRFLQRGGIERKLYLDLEAITRDPASGRLWTASESSNVVQRFDARLRPGPRLVPKAMAGWGENTGAEAFARLADGRFVVLQESSAELLGGEHRGLVFAGDPTDPATPPPRAFRFAAPGGMRPVDMAQLPDGRVLVLLRRVTWPLPPVFASALAVADPAEIAPGRVWTARPLPWNAAWPRENYEGLALEEHPEGGLRLWLIADDNEMQHWQRTLLLALHWSAGQAKGARSPAARP